MATEAEFVEVLGQVVADSGEFETEPGEQARVRTLRDLGMSGEGLVVSLPDGSVFRITVERVST